MSKSTPTLTAADDRGDDPAVTQWHYTKMGLQQGPVPEDELRTKIRRGEIGDSTLVWREGMAEWLPLPQVSELQADVPKDESSGGNAAQTVLPDKLSMPVKPLPQKDLGNIQLPQPQAFQPNIYVATKIPNYLWQSVVAIVLSVMMCTILSMPFAIVAIVFASKVESLRVQGDIAAATAASGKAKTWMIISYAVMALHLLIVVAMVVFGN